MSTAAATTEDAATISGVVTDLKFQKPTWCAGYLQSGGRRLSFSVKGFVEVNKAVTIRGVWETHPKWGKQFKGSEIVYTLPADADGIAAWLAATVDGVGKVKADAMAAAFGPSLPRLLREDPEQVAVECNLPIEFVKRIAERWWAAQDECNCCAKLAGYGLTQHEVSALFARYKGSAVAILESDPYLVLGDLPGFGWARVDGIGQKLGVPADDPGRVRAAVQTAVKKLTADGSTVCERAVAAAEAADLVGATVTPAQLEAGLAAAIEKKVVYPVGAVGLTTPDAWRDERDLWVILAGARKGNPCFPGIDPEAAAERVRGYELPTADGRLVRLDESQVAAVVLALTNRLAVITGGAGSGKTLVAKAILRFLAEHRFENARAADDDSDTWDAPIGSAAGDPRRTVALAAPTGKAARRLADVTGKPASTIHRLLGWAMVGKGQWDFTYKASCPLPYSCVVVDEFSMTDAGLAADLLSACDPHTMVVLLGDPNQLPPVGAGYPLRDILEHDLAPAARIEKCHRQAGPLKTNCVRVLQGVVEPTVMGESPGPWLVHRQLDTPEQVKAAVERLFTELFPKWGYADLMRHQFMTSKHDGPLGTRAMNELLQKLAQARLGVRVPDRGEKDTLPLVVGDKVIQTKNNYQLNVMNGTLGVVAEDSPALVVDYDGKLVAYPADQKSDVQLGYCLTPHKMQGSEVPCAVLIVPKAHAFMQHRSWLYTGLTRAQRTAVVIGDYEGIRRAADKVEVDRRQTLLRLFATTPGVRP
jgi:exodeoxyribonuclease V alpha subunit